MSWRSMPAIATACFVTSSTIWVSVISVLRTEGTCPYPTTATSTIRRGRFRYGVPASGHASAASPSVTLSLQCAHVGVRVARGHPALDAAAGAAPAAGRELVHVALRLGAPHRGDSHADAHVAHRRVEHVLQLQHPAGPVERDRDAGERLGLLLAGVLHRGDHGEVDDGAGVAELDVVVGAELDHGDRAEVARRHVDEPAVAGALLADDPAVEQCLRVPGERGRGWYLVVQRHRERHDARPVGLGVRAHDTTWKHSTSVTYPV